MIQVYFLIDLVDDLIFVSDMKAFEKKLLEGR